MRVAVIGARQARQGTGAHLARFCAEAGAHVVALCATTEATASAAVASFGEATGLRAEPIWRDELLADLPLDALVIASPDRTHERWLELALARDLHVLCEKPLVWDDAPDLHLRALALAERFRQAGLVLRVNTQWPHALAAYERLFPGAAVSARSFFMRLSPVASGPDMFRTSLPHPLSVLAAVLPDVDATVENGSAVIAAGGAEGRLSFTYSGAGRRLEVALHVLRQPEPPRAAAFGFDDRIAHREVGPGYALALQAGGRRVTLPDPTPLLVGSFLQEAASLQPRRIDPAVQPGMRHLVELMAVVPDEDGSPA